MSTNIHDLSSPVNDDSSSRKKAYFSEASPLIHQIESNKTNSILPAFLSSSGTSFITPADEYDQVYWSFWLLGAAFLIPWDSMLSVESYWSLQIQPKALFSFSISYMMTNLLGLVVVVAVGQRVSSAIRILPGLVVFVLVLVALLFLKKGDSTIYIANVLMGLMGTMDAIVQGSTYGLAGQFHPRFINAVMAGNGIAGIVISVVQITILLILPAVDNPSDAQKLERQTTMVRAFFGACGFVIVLTILAYIFILRRSPVTRYYLNKSKDERTDYVTGGDSGDAQQSSFMTIFKQVFIQGLNALLVFLVTLTLYPALASLIQPVAYPSDGKIPFFVILVTIFNTFDFIGRSLPRFDALVVVSPRFLIIPVLARFVFIPLFLFGGKIAHATNSDLPTYAIMALFALSNGYLGTLAMMFGPAKCRPADKETAGTIMVFLLTCGLTAGVWCGKLIDAVK